MSKKALFFDIDGTLLSEVTGQVPESAIESLKKAHKQGHLTFINTGRTICSIPAELKSLPFSGFICGCGTYITYGDEVIFSRSIPHERGREIIRTIQECNGDMVLEGQEDCYFSLRRSRFDALEMTRRYFEPMGLGIETYVENDNFDFDKFVIYVDDKTDQKTLFSRLEKDLSIMDRKNGFYELVPKEYSKASAIGYVLDYFSVDLDDAYVFGDSSNDLSMFAYVPHAVAMGNHDEVLDPYTEFVTKTVEDDGIAYAMKHYGIIE
ncbi:MAG: HAD family phosphatase [Clostridiales bacterium]|nr:HAD family phosphatase [Clostridiales bacterium]